MDHKIHVILKSILFEGSIENKLIELENCVFQSEAELMSKDAWAPDIQTLSNLLTPGRAGKLNCGNNLIKNSKFPKKSELKIASNRGRLLHYFANHELLAIETMAFVLLRFPGADPIFRNGVLRTLQDEQKHLRLYLSRMNELGVEFGDFPLSLYFWNTLRQMKSPLDFVTQMSLTFEQANLDFAQFYFHLFETEIDDPKTGKILKEVHADEIKHVAHGIKWFSKWRNSSESEYESYTKLLPYPMTPRRARGATFFAGDSRAKAQMSPEFIESIRIAGGSRGKVPHYYFFNPQAEIESSTPKISNLLQQKIDELAPVILSLSGEEDVVELPAIPPLSFLTQLFDFKGNLPEIVSAAPKAGKYAAFQEFRPWGFSQSAWKKMDELNAPLKNAPLFSRTLHSEKLFSKIFWKGKLENRIAGLALPIASAEESQSADLMIKLARSTSGRGHLKIPRAHLNTLEIQNKLNRIEARGEAFVIEPYYPKVNDFSFQYELLADGGLIEYDPRFFMVDHLFQYQGAVIGWETDSPYFSETAALLQVENKNIKKAHQIVIDILRECGYFGPFGIDGLSYRDQEGKLKLVPIIEVNARFTMGRVAQEIEKIAKRKKQSKGIFRILNERDLISFGARSFAELEARFKNEYGENFVALTPSSSKMTWIFVILSQDALARFLLPVYYSA